jgi:hypothetical protein
MAILGSNFLNGCNSIPGFIGGLADYPTNPSLAAITFFVQNAAPTSWTKIVDAVYNNIALRVVGGSNGSALNPGGSSGSTFTSIFSSSRALPVFAVTQQSSNISVQPASGYITIQNSPSNFQVQNDGSSTANLRSHSHPYLRAPGTYGPNAAASTQRAVPNQVVTVGTSSGGGNGSHNHGISDGQHNHPSSPGDHIHPVTITQHAHQFTMTSRNFELSYVDVIACRKD